MSLVWTKKPFAVGVLDHFAVSGQVDLQNEVWSRLEPTTADGEMEKAGLPRLL